MREARGPSVGAVAADPAPSQFYTGLVADLYEPLASEHARADDYIPFLERCGTPALELACGSGIPLVELVERGYEVEGLDASRDMLDRCRARAAERGLRVVLHRADMQSFSLGRRYRSIFLAGASFTLLTSDADAERALACIHAHLAPGGAALVPLEIPDLEAIRSRVGAFREAAGAGGERVRVAVVEAEPGPDGRSLRRRLRYERVPAAGEPEVLERDWRTRWWTQEAFAEMCGAAGFSRVRLLARTGGPAHPDDAVFVALAARGDG